MENTLQELERRARMLSPQERAELAERLLEYRDVGIDEFILSGYPHLEEALRFGEYVRPLVDQATQPALPGL